LKNKSQYGILHLDYCLFGSEDQAFVEFAQEIHVDVLRGSERDLYEYTCNEGLNIIIPAFLFLWQ
jgi:hypothetical protein